MTPEPHTPCLVMDLATIRDRYRTLTQALPTAAVYYAVKANPAPEVLATLVAVGSGFDVAGRAEIALVLEAGARPETLCFGNPVKKAADVVAAAAAGVHLFVTDSHEDLGVLAAAAPGATVLVRIMADDSGSATPFGGKFGCSVNDAVQLIRRTVELGLVAGGVSFHVGSQQLDPHAWSAGISGAAKVAAAVAPIPLPYLDLGGGFPVPYLAPVPSMRDCAVSINAALTRHFPDHRPGIAVEPGRFLAAEAGVLCSEVIRVSHRSDRRRWVYLDIGRYGGLAETEGEAIRYRLRTPYDGGPTGPAVLAGPTCDGDDVLYRDIELPLELRAGDSVDLLAAGAYTASYASVGFNGLPPLAVRCSDRDGSGESDR
ncbi:MAG: type III PLP-dependent enzyme [Pseudonocardia sp.]